MFNFRNLLTIVIAFNLNFANAITINNTQQFINDDSLQIKIDVQLSDNEFIYKDSIKLLSNDLNISNIKIDQDPATTLDELNHQTTEIFHRDFSIEFFVKKNALIKDKDFIIKLNFDENRNHDSKEFEIKIEFKKSITTETSSSKLDQIKTFINEISFKIKNTDSMILKIIFAFLLGLLLSLTPCIYPMIPITVGIFQLQSNKSIFNNFLLSLCYAFGMATTFSIMGLLAAFSGATFGNAMTDWRIILILILFLSYFAFSLFGFYNLKMPKFSNSKNTISNDGSFLKIFLFGIVSGSTASPCLSPGLALILSMVATLANKLLGFLLLFFFGIGASFPLIIIGTFSNSINMLPRAGSWMIEIQKIFGFMLFGMCLYYANNILLPEIMSLLLILFFLIIAAYYFKSLKTEKLNFWKKLKTIFIILSIFQASYLIYNSYFNINKNNEILNWYTDFETAKFEAISNNKKILIDIWAPYCSICKLIKSKILESKNVKNILDQDYIMLSVDVSKKESYIKELQSRYNVTGVPTILIVDPVTLDAIKRWQSEIYETDHNDIINELIKHK